MLFPSRLFLAVTAALSFVGTGLTWTVYETERTNRQAAFDVLAQRAARRIETRIEQHIALLFATRAFLEVHHEPMDRKVFSDFVDRLELEGRYTGLQGIGLARILTPEAETEVEASLARDYDRQVRVWPEPVPGLRTAVVLLEPADVRNRAAIGFDMATEARRRAAMLEALEAEAATATAPLTLVQEITETQQTGVVIYLPLRGTSDPALEGFAYAPVRMGDLFTAALGDDLPLEIRAVDADAPEPALFETPGYVAEEISQGLSTRADLTVAGRDWILSAQATPTFDAAEPLRQTAMTAFVFALLVLSTAAAVHWQSMAIRRSRTLNEAVQRNVEQKDWLVREMAHRLKNALTRVSAITRQTARESAGKEEMVTRLNARLQAMSAAQDLLMLSGSDSADLEELLRSEIDQISGSATSPGRLSGPPVRLDERQTHALALVFHELATNALKYGAGAQAGGDLRIAWTVEAGPSIDELRLTWEERTPGPAASAPGPGSGFGTRLLDAMVTGELGGSLLRETQEGRLRIEIRFPVVTASGAQVG